MRASRLAVASLLLAALAAGCSLIFPLDTEPAGGGDGSDAGADVDVDGAAADGAGAVVPDGSSGSSPDV